MAAVPMRFLVGIMPETFEETDGMLCRWLSRWLMNSRRWRVYFCWPPCKSSQWPTFAAIHFDMDAASENDARVIVSKLLARARSHVPDAWPEEDAYSSGESLNDVPPPSRLRWPNFQVNVSVPSGGLSS
jgi:hypothetical protein